MTSVRLLNIGEAPWLETQSIYHAVAESMTESDPDTVILAYPAQPYLCLGFHQKANAMLRPAVCDDLSLPVVRRRVGGGTTYLDSDQIFYQCVFHQARLPAKVDEIYSTLLAAPVAVLQDLGLPAVLVNVNEIEVGGKRIAGIGGGRIGDAVVVVGNLLLDFDYAILARVWHTPSDIFRDMAYEAMHDRITTLQRELSGASVAIAELQNRLASAYATALGRAVEVLGLTDEERIQQAAVEERLLSHEWLYQHGEDNFPMDKLKIARDSFIYWREIESSHGAVRLAVRVYEDVIEDVAIEEPNSVWLSPLLEQLKGERFSDLEAIVTERMRPLSETI